MGCVATISIAGSLDLIVGAMIQMLTFHQIIQGYYQYGR
ncbi:hypothetical protein PLAN_120061 [Planktothrix rubescens CCAP 1459/22]|uniref:Uncharacterized protein n=1 Tax=Planktothrix rubescens CCAP 1459/22 TaxID=329571 RepID=A0A6J7ZGJ2_PLARU|nr:hypothetical protein PLAN_120061 [Planktothrix rubescens NIVA-CYA 18]